MPAWRLEAAIRIRRHDDMRLLISVANAADASAALEGGADIIDAKDSLTGALGPVTVETLRDIHAAVAGARPVTAALGDASDEAAIERAAADFAAAGAGIVKVGFGGIGCPARAAVLIAAAVCGAKTGSNGRAGVVAAAYADGDLVASLAPAALVAVAAQAGAEGLLIDTCDKLGPGLRQLLSPAPLAQLVAEAHDTGLFVVLAGRLTADDLSFARDAGADIAGLRGAACEGGRTGRISAAKVSQLRSRCAASAALHPAAQRSTQRLPLIGRND
jgi:uncharacterized protein (UPF0264 family)